jgi:predicted DNA-binding protein
MAMLSFRITDEEKSALNSFAKLHGTSMSRAAREIIMERIEDEEDLRAITEYRNNPNRQTRTVEEIKEIFGL